VNSLMAGGVVLVVFGLPGVMIAAAEANAAGPAKPQVDAAAVARFPAPATVVPGALAFTPDGKVLTYLMPEAEGPGRVLWRFDFHSGKPRVVARAPGLGNTDTNLSQAEALRRERMRVRETGITQVARAEKADIVVLPLRGDLYLLRGDGTLDRLTQSAAAEIDPRLTADGKKLAFVREDELHVLDLVNKTETRLTHGAVPGVTHALAEYIAQEEMDRFAGYWWSPDGNRIAYQETDERLITPYTIVHQGAETYSVETHRYPFAGKPNAKVKLGVIAAGGGITTWLKLCERGQDFYLARVLWETPESLLVQILSRDQKSLRLYRFDAANGERSLLLEETSDRWINLHDQLRVLNRSGELLWSSERSGFRHLEIREHGGKLVRVLTAGNWSVDEVLAVDESRRQAWFSSGHEHPCEIQVYRVSLDGGAVERVTTEPGTHHAVVREDGKMFIDTASDRAHPPVTTVRDRDGKIVNRIDDAAADPRLQEVRLDPPVLTEYKNRDGQTLYGAYYAPRSQPPGAKVPLVVMVYGGPHVQRVIDGWTVTADMTAQFLAGRGFAVWKTDNRGSSRRGFDFESAINRNMGTVEVRDQVDGVAFAAASWPAVDPTRVGVTGGSYGGYLTLRCLTLAPKVFRAGVAIAPVTDWEGYDTCYTERYMGTPADNPKGYLASSVLPEARNISGSLLLIHGLLDENVHYRHTARLTSALIAAGRPFDILPLPESRHSPRSELDRKYVAESTSAFFERAFGRELR